MCHASCSDRLKPMSPLKSQRQHNDFAGLQDSEGGFWGATRHWFHGHMPSISSEKLKAESRPPVAARSGQSGSSIARAQGKLSNKLLRDHGASSASFDDSLTPTG